MLQSDTYKASISLKAESLGDLNEVLDLIANASGISLVTKATISTSISIEAESIDFLRRVLDGIADAIGGTLAEVDVNAKAPMDVYRNRRLDPTPMERAISRAGEE
jgi:hypothetical protein